VRRTVTYDGIEYAPGRRFRVIRDGLKLTGMVHGENPGSFRGWSQQLNTGDIITCTGFGPGLGGDPGYGVEWTTPEAEAAGAVHVDMKPQFFVPFGYRPHPGSVEAVQ
jgi:hypothetical protein